MEDTDDLSDLGDSRSHPATSRSSAGKGVDIGATIVGGAAMAEERLADARQELLCLVYILKCSMCVCVCVCVCMYVCVCVYMYCLWVCVHMFLCICLYVHSYVYVYTL